jgi:FixJ family two-component response regulator
MIQAQEDTQDRPLVLIVDDDSGMRDAVGELMLSIGMDAAGYGSTRELLAEDFPDRPGCLVLDVRMPGISGLDLQKQLNARGVTKPIIFLTAYADVPMTVEAMKAGAVDFFTKPFRDQALLDAVGQAIQIDLRQRQASAQARRNIALFSSLTPREKQVFRQVAEGKLNKQIAYSLDISEVTVKLHRGNVMRKMQARSLGELMKAWSTLPQS